MTWYCDVTNSVYLVTMTTIRHCSILEFGRRASNQAVAPEITRPLHATARGWSSLRLVFSQTRNVTVIAFTRWIYLIENFFTLPWKTEFAVKFSTVLNIFFTIQDFWATCACPEKQSLPWNFSLHWVYFYHSRFLSNLRLPWKQNLPWNFSRQGGGRLLRPTTSYAYAALHEDEPEHKSAYSVCSRGH